MGRKAAPQPLALGSGNENGTDPNLTSEINTSGNPLSLFSGKTAPQPTRLGVVPENRPSGLLHTPSSASPTATSKRSPFRFAAKRSQSVGGPLLSAQSVEDSLKLEQQWIKLQEKYQKQRRDDKAAPSSLSSHLVKHPQLSASQEAITDTDPTRPHDTANNTHEDNTATTNTKPAKSGFFFFGKGASRSNNGHNTQPSNNLGQGHEQPDVSIDTMSRSTDSPTPSKHSAYPAYADSTSQKPQASKSELSLISATDPFETNNSNAANKKGKQKPFNILSRNKSSRDTDNIAPDCVPPETIRLVESDSQDNNSSSSSSATAAVKGTLFKEEWTSREGMGSSIRNISEERGPRDTDKGPRSIDATSSGGSLNKENQQIKDSQKHQAPLGRENAFFSNLLKSSSNRAAEMIGKGLFGSRGWNGPTAEERPQTVDDEHYQIKVLNLPLIEQTRATRISKRLEESRDKTEFWMPAFPWRAIDYLNYKGSDVEGLYRVPGSGQQVRKWQRRFDEEHDVDLFAQDDLYDINIVGSMLKAWLRELPDELLPKNVQERVSRECAGAETVPQLLIDELSNLSPFNYYLLFAITCHLSLLLAHSEKNKMDFRNLCICFQPCMKIDAFCFKFLVCEWRECWKGCKNEGKYIEEEYMLFDQPPPRGLTEPRKPSQAEISEERNAPSPDGGKSVGGKSVVSTGSPASNGGVSVTNQKVRIKKKLPLSESTGSVASVAPVPPTLTVISDRDANQKAGGDLRPLSPIKPLSPMSF